MAFLSLAIPPGVYRNGTERQASGRYYNTNLVRWIDGTLRPIGGWRNKTATLLSGSARSIIQWTDNSDNSWASIGTNSKLYVMDRGGTVTNITPARASGTLGTDPITTVNTDNTVTVADTAHGLTVGDTAVLAGATATGGLTINGTWTVATVPTADTWTFEHTSPATSGATGGGAAVTYLYEISPGLATATATGGFGDGLYSDDTYGTPRDDADEATPAAVWSLDTFGQYLNAMRDDNGTAYDWQLNTSNRAVAISGAPTGKAIVTTAEGFLFILGAGGNDRKVQWPDQADNTSWTPSATTQAGSYTLETAGQLMCGVRVGGGTLVLTTVDAWTARYTADVSVYAFKRVGNGCGAISRKAACSIGDIAVWMGDGQFYIYNGYVSPLPCDVEDYVFSSLNRLQRSKVTCTVNSQYSEVIWFYPSDEGTENDRYVKFNYVDNVWDIGTLARTCASDRAAFDYPLYVDSTGQIHEHEVGWSYSAAVPFAEAGPISLGQGDNFMRALQLLPDEKTQGDATITFKTRFYPNGDETTYGPYTAANPTDVRFQGRSVKVRYDFTAAADSRVGAPILDVIVGDKR